MIPLVVSLFYLPDNCIDTICRDTLATIIFISAALTDWFDGWIARRWKQTSTFGAFLDPVADKLMVCTALILLVKLNRLDASIALVIISREIVISALREWMEKTGSSNSVAVYSLGKVKTAFQMIALPCLFYEKQTSGYLLHQIGLTLITISAILATWSMFYYFICAWPKMHIRDIE